VVPVGQLEICGCEASESPTNVKRKRHKQAACWFLYPSEKNQAMRKIIYVKEIIP